MNLSPKNKRGQRAEPDLTPDDITKLDLIKFTKSNLLGFVNGIFDPSGVMGPFTVKLKLELRRLFKDKNSELEWHESVPELIPTSLDLSADRDPPTTRGLLPMIRQAAQL